MTQEQIKEWEYCNKYAEALRNYKINSSVKSQHHGCGSRDPKITFDLEAIHKDLYKDILNAFIKAEKRVQKIIEGI